MTSFCTGNGNGIATVDDVRVVPRQEEFAGGEKRCRLLIVVGAELKSVTRTGAEGGEETHAALDRALRTVQARRSLGEDFFDETPPQLVTSPQTPAGALGGEQRQSVSVAVAAPSVKSSRQWGETEGNLGVGTIHLVAYWNSYSDSIPNWKVQWISGPATPQSGWGMLVFQIENPRL